MLVGAVGIELLELIRTLQTRRLLILRSDKREQNRKNAKPRYTRGTRADSELVRMDERAHCREDESPCLQSAAAKSILLVRFVLFCVPVRLFGSYRNQAGPKLLFCFCSRPNSLDQAATPCWLMSSAPRNLCFRNRKTQNRAAD